MDSEDISCYVICLWGGPFVLKCSQAENEEIEKGKLKEIL